MSVELPIYFDYAATTPVDERVAKKMCNCLTREGIYGNPGSHTHRFGWWAAELVDKARKQVAELINAEPKEIIFTSGATEANNLAIKGVALKYKNKGRHIITSKVEHKAVIEPCKYLQEQGFDVTFLDPEPDGTIALDKLEAAIRDDTILISLMHVNNELGSINDIAAFGKLAHECKIIFHVDAAQSAGKLPIDVRALHVDLMSFSGHKVYGPKGIGALFINKDSKLNLVPQMHGGRQERGFRSGTMATHQIVGMGEAFAIAKEELAKESARLAELRRSFWDKIKDIDAIKLNGSLEHGAPHILNVSFGFIEGESIIMALKDIAVSTGSACSSDTLELSYVLTAIGAQNEMAHGSIRFSFGRYTTVEEIDYAAKLIREKVAQLRSLSPLWDMYKQGVDLETISWKGDH
ncbi:MAG: IscS subfamily cysteine desulfurase [Gammaproteobacteria bacterium]|nr:IscS subfamily cysteine desulfurase [Gammaproteobacteria bacterium]